MEQYKWIKDIEIYMNIVERINQHFNNMIRTLNHDKIEEEAIYFCKEILRIIPLDGKEELQITKKDGICLLKNDINFLIEDLNKILQKNMDIFKKIKIIRNKYEHEPHNVKSVFSTGSGAYSGIGFYYKNELISINTMEITYIIYDLNILMNKIQQLIYKTEKEYEEEFDIYVQHSIKNIKKTKIIEYNKNYIRIPRLIDLDKKIDEI